VNFEIREVLGKCVYIVLQYRNRDILAQLNPRFGVAPVTHSGEVAHRNIEASLLEVRGCDYRSESGSMYHLRW
jgi:hypothetical protein